MSSNNSQEDKELKALTDLILKSLEAKGSLSSITAQLRQTVYNTVNDENAPASAAKDASIKTSKQQPVVKDTKGKYKASGPTSDSSSSKPAASAVLRAAKNEDEKLTLLLVKELLQAYNMDYSLNTFANESNLLSDVSRATLASQSNTNQSGTKPLLVQLVSSAINGTLPQAKVSAPAAQNTSSKAVAGVQKATTENLSASRKFSSFKQNNYESNNDIEESMGGFDALSNQEEDEDYDYYEDNKKGKATATTNSKNNKTNSKNKKTNPMFSSMEDTIGASMSHGYDQSVDSMDLEQDYDYYEDISKR